MKVSPEELAYILNVANTAKLIGIDNVIIEPGVVRAMDEARTIVIFQKENVESMQFEAIGITRISDLLARYDIASSTDNFSVDATVSDNSPTYATKLTMKGKGTKIEYGCGDPTKINAPRQIADTLKYRVALNGEAVSLLQKGNASMKCENVTIVSDDGVSFQLVDVSHDVFKHTFADDADLIPDSEGNVAPNTKFAHRYPVKTLLALFKSNPIGLFSIGQKGILSFTINGLTAYVLPQV